MDKRRFHVRDVHVQVFHGIHDDQGEAPFLDFSFAGRRAVEEARAGVQVVAELPPYGFREDQERRFGVIGIYIAEARTGKPDVHRSALELVGLRRDGRRGQGEEHEQEGRHHPASNPGDIIRFVPRLDRAGL